MSAVLSAMGLIVVTSPAQSEYAAGGTTTTTSGTVTASGAGSTAIGGGAGTTATATGPNAIAIGSGTKATSVTLTGGAIIPGITLGINATATATNTQAGILDRTIAVGGTTLATAVTGAVGGATPAAVAIGNANTVTKGGTAIGDTNKLTGDGPAAAVGTENLISASFGNAFGYSNSITASSATAIGIANVASGNTAIAIGRQNTASGAFAIAQGNLATASATQSMAFGHSVKATGIGAIALGGAIANEAGAGVFIDATATAASGANSIAIGQSAIANAANATALGSGGTGTAATAVTASAAGAVAIGGNATAGAQALGQNAIAIGGQAVAQIFTAVAIGQGAKASSASGSGDSLALGAGAQATGQDSSAIGGQSVASNTDAIALGGIGTAAGADATTASGTQSTAIGYGAKATAGFATALGTAGTATGKGVTASGIGAIALGGNATAGASASAADAIAIGGQSAASGVEALALGKLAAASGADSIAIGQTAKASGTQSIAIGFQNNVSGNNSVAIGDPNTVAGTNAFVLGNNNTVAGNNTVTLGNTNTNAGNNSFVVGNNASTATATGGSIVIGDGAATKSTVNNGTVLGSGASVSLANSVALGSGSTASAVTATTTYTTANSIVAGKTFAITQAPANGVVAIGNRQIQGVADGEVSATSTNAINGSQLFAVANGLNTNIGNLGTNVAAALGAGAAYNTTTGAWTAPAFTLPTTGATTYGNAQLALNALASGGAKSKYFNANSTLPDSSATGANSVAIGGSAVAVTASGAGATAIGGNATAGANASAADTIAIGGQSAASATEAIAIGKSAAASGIDSIAIGQTAKAGGTLSIAIGFQNNVSGANSGAFGDPNVVAGSNSFAFGNNNTVTANKAFAIGNGITIAAGLDGSVGIGDSTTVGKPNTGTFALYGGTAAGTTPASVVSIGSATAPRQLNNVAAGVISATSLDAINGSQLFTVQTGIDNLGNSVAADLGGTFAYNTATGKVAGNLTLPATGATTYSSVQAALNALSGTATAGLNFSGNSGVTINVPASGTLPIIGASTNAVGLAFDTAAPAASTYSSANIQTFADKATGKIQIQLADAPVFSGVITSKGITQVAGSVINMGNNVVGGVAAGSLAPGSSDAVNGGQINTGLGSVATAIGGTSTFNPVTGKVAAGLTLPSTGATTYTDVQSALNALATGGAASKYFHANSILADSQANGTNSVAIGPTAQANGNASIASGLGANAGGNGASAYGLNASAAGTNSTALGANASAINPNDVALGAGSVTAAPVNTGPFTLNGGTASATAPASVLSIGALGAERRITNVAAGNLTATSTDAVNGSQLFAVGTAVNNLGSTVATTIGGGMVVNPDGTIKIAPTLKVGGTAYTDVASAINGLQSGAPVQYTTAKGSVTPNGFAPSNTMTLVGTGAGNSAPVTLTNVGPGALTATSIDAVNGGQINVIDSSIATNFGGGSTFDPVTGKVLPPSYAVAGGTFSDVGSALSALNTQAGKGLNFTGNDGSVINVALGGTLPIIGGSAKAAGLAFSAVAPTAGSYSSANIQTFADKATGQIQIQLADAPVFAGAITSKGITQVAGSIINMGNNVVGGVAPGSTATGSTDAVNGGQLNTIGSSIATNFGGGSSYDSVTGKVLPPTYNVAGGTFSDVGSALNALNGTASKGLNFTGNDGSVINVALGGTLPIIGGSAKAAGLAFSAVAPTAGTYSSANIQTFADKTTGQIQVQLADAPVFTGPVTAAGLTMTPGSTIDMGNNVITNVAPGSTAVASTGAVNGGQINTIGSSIANNFGGGAVYDPATGKVLAPTYNVAGGSFNDVGSALTALNSQAGKGLNFTGNDGSILNIALGGTLPIIGGSTKAAGLAFSAVAPTAGTYSSANIQTFADKTTGQIQIQVADNPVFTSLTTGNSKLDSNGLAITGGPSVLATGIDAGNKIISNVALGSTAVASTDAVNGGQINTIGTSIATNFGGGSTYDPTTDKVLAPTYNVAGGSFNDVGSALSALNTQAGKGLNFTGNDGSILNIALGGTLPIVGGSTKAAGLGFSTAAPTAGTYSSANVQTFADAGTGQIQVQLADAPVFGGPINAGGLTIAPGSNIDMGNNVVTNVAPGSTAVTSTDAVNGGQINTIGSSIASNFGGGAIYDPVTGKVTAPNYPIGSTTYNDVGSALSALDNSVNGGAGIKYFHANSVLADSSAAGTNSIAVGPVAAASATDAIAIGNGAQAANAGDIAIGAGSVSAAPNTGVFDLTGGTAQATAPASVVSIGSVGNERQLQNVAAGVLSATSTDAVNGSQLFSVATSSNTLGNTVASTLGGATKFDPASGISGYSTAYSGGAQTTVISSLDALNSYQTNAAPGLAAALGGGAAVAPDGTVTPPTYTVSGNSYNDVGSALTALNSTANAGWNLSTNGGAATNIAPGATVDIGAGSSNVVISQTGTNVKVDLAPDLKLTSLTTGNATLDTNGLSIVGGPSVLATGIDAGGKAITNVADGVNAADAVNKGQLDAVATTAGKGFNVTTAATGTGKVTGTAVANVAPGGTQTFTAGNNIEITQNGTEVQIATSLTPTFDTVTAGGLKVNPGSTIDFGGNLITNVAQGVANGDAVNVGQLNAAIAAVGAAAPVQYVDANGNKVATPTNEVTLVGASGPVVIHNLAAGVAPTDAVNVSQLEQQTPGAFSTPTSNAFVLGNAKASGAGPIILSNLGPGSLSAASTEAVNGSQLYATNQAVSNLASLTNGLQGQIDANKNLAKAGTASAMALGMIRYDDRPGKLSMGIAAAAYGGQGGMAIGAGYTSEDMRLRASVGGTFSPTNPDADIGVGGSLTWTFN